MNHSRVHAGILCAALLMSATAQAQQVLHRDDFNAPSMSKFWEQTYPEKERVQMKVVDGALDVRYGTCWVIGPKQYTPAEYPGGLSVSLDMRFYPQPRYEWKACTEFHPFGFQDNKGGVGRTYARFTLKDTNKDGKTDAVQFQSRTAKGQRDVTVIPNYNPVADPKPHRFRIDWKPYQIEAYFDGKLVAVHEAEIAMPLWVSGRNESGGTVLDNFELRALAPENGTVGPVRIEAGTGRFRAPPGAKIIEDPAASGGRAVHILGDKKRVLSDATLARFPAQKAPGMYAVTLRMKLDDAYDIGRAWRVDILVDDQIQQYGVAQGYYFKGKQGYQDFEIEFPLEEPGKAPVAKMYWAFDGWYPADESSPKLTLDTIALVKKSELPALRIRKVWPDKVHYLRDEKGSVAVTVKNTTAHALDGRIRIELSHDLDDPKVIATVPVRLDARQERTIESPLNIAAHYRGEAADYGYGVRATAFLQGKAVSSAREYVCVADNPHLVATTWGPFTGENDPRDARKYSFHNRWVKKFNESHLSEEGAAAGALEARRDYVTYWEYGRGGATSPGGCMDLAPEEDFWIDGDSGAHIVGKRARQRGVAALKKHGILCVTYNIPMCQGMTTEELLHKHPEWFALSKDTKDFTTFGYSVVEFRKREKFLKTHDLSRIRTNNGYMTPRPKDAGHPAYFGMNFNNREVMDHVSDQMVAAMKMFGFVGVRWDCGHLNTGAIQGAWQPFLDFYGKPLCSSPDEMVAQTVANIRYFKQRAKQENPNFCFGTNYGSFEETRRYPEMTRELCRDGGWLMDETSYTYLQLHSAYRFWDKYYEVMSDQGNYVASLGGHYMPFAPTRFGCGNPADRIYHMLFGLAGHGHAQLYFRNSCFVTGDPAQFAVRFGRYLFDTSLLRVENPAKIIRVASSRPLWWKKSVWRKTDGPREVLVIHLINPPVTKVIGENSKSTLPSSARNVSVSCRIPAGKSRVKVWALTAESWTSDQPSRTQAVPLEVEREGPYAGVRVPEILIWKSLVFKYE